MSPTYVSPPPQLPLHSAFTDAQIDSFLPAFEVPLTKLQELELVCGLSILVLITLQRNLVQCLSKLGEFQEFFVAFLQEEGMEIVFYLLKTQNILILSGKYSDCYCITKCAI